MGVYCFCVSASSERENFIIVSSENAAGYGRMFASRGGYSQKKTKSGGGVRPASQNPYAIYDQNLRYSLPYL